MNLENTKVYTKDLEVVRKYAALCGRDFDDGLTGFDSDIVGVALTTDEEDVGWFSSSSTCHNSHIVTTITPEQINALYDEKFGSPGNLEPKDGEWWMCNRGGVNTVLLRLEDDWRGDDNDTYSYSDAIPIYRMVKESEIFDIMSQDNEKLQNREMCNHSEVPNSSEWNNGDECIWNGIECVFIGMSNSHPSIAAVEYLKGFISVIDKVYVEELRKPETPEQREERERLEAAYDLYCAYLNDESITPCPFNEFIDRPSMWLRIVDKTGYRKQKDGE